STSSKSIEQLLISILFIFFAIDVLLKYPKIDKIISKVELTDTFFIFK
ncbi:hypothetical protein J538_3405, partial [Acinetobacter sp. 272263]